MGLRINAIVINAFLAPALEHLRILTGSDTALERMEICSELPSTAFTMRIDVHGSLEGAVYWSFDSALAERLAIYMLPPGSRTQDTGLKLDAVAELANIIVGNATGNLLESGYDVQFLPPRHQAGTRLANGHPNLVLLTPVGRVRIVFELQIALPRAS